ncbi:MAG: 50S ribosomal protein L7ae [Firmicutes bacterium]|nr:50S ribosomal protein L7ae [Bacillota bacterium]
MKSLFSLLGLARRAGKLTSGITNCLHALAHKEARLIILAEDAGRNREKVIKACLTEQVPYLEFGSRQEFLKYLGQSSCIWAVLCENFAQQILKYGNGILKKKQDLN